MACPLAVSSWSAVAGLRLMSKSLASAFEHNDLARARSL
jgi:hypothetical protein